MKKVLLLLLLYAPLSFSSVEKTTIDSKLLNENVGVKISLPYSYHHSSDYKYPVFVILDGSVQFDHVAGNIKFLSLYAMIPEMMVIGVETPFERFAMYTDGDSGKADLYRQFLEGEMLQSLSKEYRLAPYRIISGHSLAGYFSSLMALNDTSNFNAAISASPSLWVNEFSLSKRYDSLKDVERKPMRWFLSLASEPDGMKEGFDRMMASLTQEPPKNMIWSLKQYPNETHDSTPLQSNIDGFKAIFDGWNAVPEIDVLPLAKLLEFYKAKSSEYGHEFFLNANQYCVYGLKATYEKKPDWGVEILEQGVKDFPASDLLWSSLAAAYEHNNQLKDALAASNKALTLIKQQESDYASEIIAQNKLLTQKLVKPSI